MNRPGDEGVCRTCKAKLVYLTTKAGALMPAQKVTLVYTREGNRVHRFDPVSVLDIREFYVNHFQTCPNASEHSRKEAAKDGEPRQTG